MRQPASWARNLCRQPRRLALGLRPRGRRPENFFIRSDKGAPCFHPAPGPAERSCWRRQSWISDGALCASWVGGPHPAPRRRRATRGGSRTDGMGPLRLAEKTPWGGVAGVESAGRGVIDRRTRLERARTLSGCRAGEAGRASLPAPGQAGRLRPVACSVPRRLCHVERRSTAPRSHGSARPPCQRPASRRVLEPTAAAASGPAAGCCHRAVRVSP